MATIAVDIFTRELVRPRPAPRRSPEGDEELIRLCRAVLDHEHRWGQLKSDGLTYGQSEARSKRWEKRYFMLRDKIGSMDPTTLVGLAWLMRAEFAFGGRFWAPAAMLRPTGPTEDELEETCHQEHMAWLFIDHLERIAGIRQAAGDIGPNAGGTS